MFPVTTEESHILYVCSLKCHELTSERWLTMMGPLGWMERDVQSIVGYDDDHDAPTWSWIWVQTVCWWLWWRCWWWQWWANMITILHSDSADHQFKDQPQDQSQGQWSGPVIRQRAMIGDHWWRWWRANSIMVCGHGWLVPMPVQWTDCQGQWPVNPRPSVKGLSPGVQGPVVGPVQGPVIRVPRVSPRASCQTVCWLLVGCVFRLQLPFISAVHRSSVHPQVGTIQIHDCSLCGQYSIGLHSQSDTHMWQLSGTSAVQRPWVHTIPVHVRFGAGPRASLRVSPRDSTRTSCQVVHILLIVDVFVLLLSFVCAVHQLCVHTMLAHIWFITTICECNDPWVCTLSPVHTGDSCHASVQFISHECTQSQCNPGSYARALFPVFVNIRTSLIKFADGLSSPQSFVNIGTLDQHNIRQINTAVLITIADPIPQCWKSTKHVHNSQRCEHTVQQIMHIPSINVYHNAPIHANT